VVFEAVAFGVQPSDRSFDMKRQSILTPAVIVTLCVVLTRPADARTPTGGTKITRTYEDEFIDPVAGLAKGGRRVTLTMGGPAREHPQGTTIDVLVIVEQESTGALAMGNGTGFSATPDGPESATFTRDARAVGKARFEQGPAIACYFAEEHYRGEVIRRWSRCEDVLLFEHAGNGPVLKGDLPGDLTFDEDGFATFAGIGHLTLMGRVVVYGEIQFSFDEDTGGVLGIGVMAIEAASGEFLVSNVSWEIDADGNGDLEFRWPGEIVFADGTTVASSGRFVELPFGGLKGTSSLDADVDWGDGYMNRRITSSILMTGEIVDPDPLD
jgi:hypothetical protein